MTEYFTNLMLLFVVSFSALSTIDVSHEFSITPSNMRLLALLFLSSVAAKRSLLAKRGPSSGPLLRRRLKKSSKTKKACTGTFAAPPPSPQRLCGI